MLRRYAQILRDAINERAIEVETELLAKDSRYQELIARLCELLDKIERNLPPEMQRLVFELDDVLMEQGALEIRTMYLQGLYDRLSLERFWMKVCGMRARKSRKKVRRWFARMFKGLSMFLHVCAAKMHLGHTDTRHRD